MSKIQAVPKDKLVVVRPTGELVQLRIGKDISETARYSDLIQALSKSSKPRNAVASPIFINKMTGAVLNDAKTSVVQFAQSSGTGNSQLLMYPKGAVLLEHRYESNGKPVRGGKSLFIPDQVMLERPLTRLGLVGNGSAKHRGSVGTPLMSAKEAATVKSISIRSTVTGGQINESFVADSNKQSLRKSIDAISSGTRGLPVLTIYYSDARALLDDSRIRQFMIAGLGLVLFVFWTNPGALPVVGGYLA